MFFFFGGLMLQIEDNRINGMCAQLVLLGLDDIDSNSFCKFVVGHNLANQIVQWSKQLRPKQSKFRHTNCLRLNSNQTYKNNYF